MRHSTGLLVLLGIMLLTACGESAPKSDSTVQPTVPLPPPAAFASLKNCIACHNATGNMVGPSWHTIADKYKGDGTASDRLATKVLLGGAGSFGAVAMPPQKTKLTPDEANYLVAWILKGAPN